MNKRERVIWFTGIFEGEGTFRILREEKAKGLQIPSTDLDVLEKIKYFFGGEIYKTSKRKDHWKDCWVWQINSEKAYALVVDMQPYLLSRRLSRSKEWIDLYLKGKKEAQDKKQFKLDRDNLIFRLWSEGLNHSQIAKKVSLHRTTVLKILKNKPS